MNSLLKVLQITSLIVLALLRWVIVLPRLLLKFFLILVSIILTVAFAIFLVQVLWISPRDIAYRYVPPGPTNAPNACTWQQNNPTALANFDNSEDKAQLAGKGQAGLECMLQYHVVPSLPNDTWYKSDRPIGPISYYLSFLEFQESGRLAEKGIDGSFLARSQLAVLTEHLDRQKNNYVFVFVHGWRHDARIGDDNVRNARVYAAHAASALDYRCKTTGKDCDYTVTAVYVGWRGARVDERAIEAFADRHFGFRNRKISGLFKTAVGDVPAALTLFDRKPISERIAPSVVASLRNIDRLLKQRNADASKADRMIVIGHSLGGNILATGLNAAMIEKIRLHTPGEVLQSPLGNLVIMLNPAAEAWKWTSLQREMRLRVNFPENLADKNPRSKDETDFFPANQPPVFISITSAFSWPAAALTQLELNTLQGHNMDIEEMKALAQYDAATHDAFPLFKGNFQPLSETLDRLANWFPTSEPGRGTIFPDKKFCGTWKPLAGACQTVVVSTLRSAAAVVRNVPFTNSASDDTLTIGHLNPVRPPYSTFKSGLWESPLPYGTTSELVVNNSIGHKTRYTNAGSSYLSECAMVDHWLWKARHNPGAGTYTGWDSGFSSVNKTTLLVTPDVSTPNVTPIRPRSNAADGHLEIQFRQYLMNSGTRSIVTLSDPMWNIRAYDTTVAFHGGYVSYPLICALNQLVMDDIASEPKN